MLLEWASGWQMGHGVSKVQHCHSMDSEGGNVWQISFQHEDCMHSFRFLD